MSILNKFLKNESGNFAVIFSVAALPVIAAVAVSVDYSNLSRLSFNLSDAVDSTCAVVAREFLAGKTNDESKLAGKNFFDVNIDPGYAASSAASFVMPDDPLNTSKTLTCVGTLTYNPLFGPVMAKLMNGNANDYVTVIQSATMKMKSLAEIALVLDNSGSMDFDNAGKVTASGSTVTRMALLKSASVKLVTEMIDFGAKVQSTGTPVQFSIVPFASMVNVGPNNASASWMDTTGISPVHHEHLNWGTPGVTNPTGYVSAVGAMPKLNAAGQPLTRFSIYNALQVRNGGTEASVTAATSQCAAWRASSTSTTNDFSRCGVFNRTGTLTAIPVPTTAISGSVNPTTYAWKGCVEARTGGLDMTDASANSAAGKFVPSFAPDQFNSSYYYGSSYPMRGGINNWWPDYETKHSTAPLGYWNNNNTTQATNSPATTSARSRETDVAKYFAVKPFTTAGSGGRSSEWSYYTNPYTVPKDGVGTYQGNPVAGAFGGPNSGCTVTPITPLTANKATLTTAINNMASFGGTNAAEGLAWGWRTLSPDAPFTGGAGAANKDLDRVVILLTDGANQLLSVNGTDYATNRSGYSAYGVTGYKYSSTSGAVGTATSSAADARVFESSGIESPAYTSAKYTEALNLRMDKICDNIKAEKYILMTVALDLVPSTTVPAFTSPDQPAIDALKKCAGVSKSKKNADGTPFKLSWNATSSTLTATFKEIADELSNLRFTQ